MEKGELELEKKPSHQGRPLQVRQVTQQFSGPLPPPGMLEHYERILPGAATRIFKMAEDQSAHRRTLEAKVISADITSRTRGQNYGLAIALVGLGSATWMAVTGHTVSASIIGGIDLIALVTVFVVGHQKKARDLDTKREETPKPVDHVEE